jgi:uncharacterized protein (TIGR02145 family)
MKKIMKRILFIAAIGCMTHTGFAQGAEVCQGTGYTIADAVPASAGSEYRWVENGNVLSGNNQATYDVPTAKAAGVYTYVRQSKSAECPDWQSSNEFTVTVFVCTFTAGSATGATAIFTDPRDGKKYKTVVMPDGKTWFAQNLNYTKDLTFNQYVYEANGKQFASIENGGVPAIGSYWCPPVSVSAPVVSGDQGDCNMYGALYTWETAMMVDGKYADASKSNTAWEESWVSGNYYAAGAPGVNPIAAMNNARGGRGICPPGWHVPTDLEWAQLLDKVEGESNTTYTVSQTNPGVWGATAGAKLKSASTYTETDPGKGSWLEHANRGTNETGFGAVPCGYKSSDGRTFGDRGSASLMWNSSVIHGKQAWCRQLYYNTLSVNRMQNWRSAAYAVRCLKTE